MEQPIQQSTTHFGNGTTLENYYFGLKDGKILKKNTVMKSNKCNQCDYASSQAGDLRRHLKTHSGEKSQKCNQCDYATYHTGHLKTHIKTHTGEKPNKCSQCEYASSRADQLRLHFKRHVGKIQTIVPKCIEDVRKEV